jgi:hypothetical protein
VGNGGLCVDDCTPGDLMKSEGTCLKVTLLAVCENTIHPIYLNVLVLCNAGIMPKENNKDNLNTARTQCGFAG